MDEPMAESMGDMAPGQMARHPTVNTKRRRELAHMAEAIADRVERETQPHERCLLRRMVENLLET